MKDNKSIVAAVNAELAQQTSDPAVMRTLIATTFKGFKDEKVVKQACLEAMMRGYKFQDLLNKKIYAIPFKNGYSLVQSISDVRAIAMRGGQVGKDAPVFEINGDKIVSCTVTVKRKLDDYVGDYTATVYFDEYDKGRDNWVTKPKTMIAKVAEMHALRMAFPEELSQSYVEEEFQGKEAPNTLDDRLAKAQQETGDMRMGSLVQNTPVEESVEGELAEEKQSTGVEGVCTNCKATMPSNVHEFSVKRFGKPLCYTCQKAK